MLRLILILTFQLHAICVDFWETFQSQRESSEGLNEQRVYFQIISFDVLM